MRGFLVTGFAVPQEEADDIESLRFLVQTKYGILFRICVQAEKEHEAQRWAVQKVLEHRYWIEEVTVINVTDVYENGKWHFTGAALEPHVEVSDADKG